LDKSKRINNLQQSNFSALNRGDWLTEIKTTEYDLVIIGGGITGAGILLDATSRGMKCILFEKNDFAWGTSSRSTKLIHGGLRYLKQLEFGLVHETGTERAVIYNNAPHIVLPEDMLLPIYKNGSLGEWTTSFGLKVYDFLAGVDRSEHRKMMSIEEVSAKEPLLKTDLLQGGGIYKEYRTNDARLVIETLKKANQYKARALNYSKVSNFLYDENNQINGVTITDELLNNTYKVKTKAVINATGPWVDEVIALSKETYNAKLQLTKGVHIVVPYKRLPLKQSVYFDVPDGRMIFAIPRSNTTYIGTTDTFYNKEVDSPTTSQADKEYLLDAANHMFPSVKLTKADIESDWAGLRPLINEDGKSPSELSRKDEIFISPNGLISIAGGKLTGYRKMAKRAVEKAATYLEEEHQLSYDESFTKQIKLSGGDFKHPKDIHILNSELQQTYQNRIDNARMHQLVFRYGSNTPKILENAALNGLTTKSLLNAEIEYCIKEEMVICPSDFFNRRTGMLYFEKPAIANIFDAVLNQLKSQLPTHSNFITDDATKFKSVL